MEQIVGSTLKKNESEDQPVQVLQKVKLVGLYFSASWCPPCTKFTVTLNDFYQLINSENHQFEIVLVPFDKSEKAFEDYFKKMGWLSIPFGNAKIDEVSKQFEVSGIPRFFILTPKGDVISTDGRKEVTTMGEEAFAGWLKIAETKK